MQSRGTQTVIQYPYQGHEDHHQQVRQSRLTPLPQPTEQWSVTSTKEWQQYPMYHYSLPDVQPEARHEHASASSATRPTLPVEIKMEDDIKPGLPLVPDSSRSTPPQESSGRTPTPYHQTRATAARQTRRCKEALSPGREPEQALESRAKVHLTLRREGVDKPWTLVQSRRQFKLRFRRANMAARWKLVRN